MTIEQTESLWSQIGRQAISGPLRGQRLEMIPLLHTTWGRWRKEHPDGLSSPETRGTTETTMLIPTFPLDRMADLPRPVRAPVGGMELFVYWFPDSETAFATTLKGDPVPATIAYWFAWSAFHPSTGVWTPKPAERRQDNHGLHRL